jgi:cyanuric acid amidohydrolase
MSGGTEGGMAPHWVVFERAEGSGAGAASLAFGRAHTPAHPAEHLGRMQQVEIVVSAVRAALAETGIDKPGDVHFVQVKCPLLTAQRVGEAAALWPLRDTLRSMGLSRAGPRLRDDRCEARFCGRDVGLQCNLRRFLWPVSLNLD